ncbi:hypothetical protein IOD16_11495 [Saccharothrix sp. 6-C]|uniref:hypothetical protein n=1 Tax=Saccharothrix sp. 6-C TaxID=2781735 RepID=UPI0019177D96|nr:hypothetical protein [Saccharothrix sp. 6-C]QQQ78990.1 hypothetical protein IOD16_11495 [Saccharothrix sp. 6-C]
MVHLVLPVLVEHPREVPRSTSTNVIGLPPVCIPRSRSSTPVRSSAVGCVSPRKPTAAPPPRRAGAISTTTSGSA